MSKVVLIHEHGTMGSVGMWFQIIGKGRISEVEALTLPGNGPEGQQGCNLMMTM